jgi:hypothetical protein
MLVSVIAVFLAGSAGAQSLQYLSTDGAVFAYEKNKHGAVLTSIESLEEPLFANGGDSVGSPPGDILYIGRSCDAFSKDYGSGNWSWTNGGFIIEFPDIRVAFPGQAIDLAPGNRCRM